MKYCQTDNRDKIVVYEHHGRMMNVVKDRIGMHRELCLCYQDCSFFNPEDRDKNCPIAQKLYELCVQHGLATPVVECETYKLAT